MNPVLVTLNIIPVTNEKTLVVHPLNIEKELTVSEQIVAGDILPWYEGDYEVAPQVSSQTLETENKSMRSDLVIKESPYSAVTNPSGGRTITIA